MTPTNELKKAEKSGKYYPSQIAESFISYKKTKQAVVGYINKFFNKEVVDYGKVMEVNKEISMRQKEIEDPSVGIRDKQDAAFNSIVSTSLVYYLSKEASKRQKARWLPSRSGNASLDHIRNYYKIFYLDEGIDGELPGERPNCKCGYELVKEDEE